MIFDIKKQKEELDRLQKKYPVIHILQGIEMGYKPIDLKRMNEVVENNHFDVVNFSLHETDGIDYYRQEPFKEKGIKEMLNFYFKQILEMVTVFDNYDILCHIDYGFKTAYLIDNSVSINEFEDIVSQIMRIIIQKDKTLEINTKVQGMLPIEHTLALLRIYKELGGKNISLSSDAHKVDRFCADFDKYISIIKEAGFDHLDYFIDRKRHVVKISELL